MTVSSYPSIPEYDNDHVNLFKRIINVAKGIMLGKTNNVNEVTLTAGAATTDVTLADGQLGPYSYIMFMPTTANAATEFGAGSLYVSEINADRNAAVSGLAARSFRITHANNANTDRTFRYVIVG